MADLTKFGVPTAGGNAMVMPKLQYRFRVQLYNFGVGNGTTLDLTQNVMSVTRPSLTHDEITLDSYNSKVYLAGKHTWEPLTLTVRDDINNTVTKQISQQLQKQLSQGLQSAPTAGRDYKFGMVIEQLDGSNGGAINVNGGGNGSNVLETWSLNGCFIQNANYGENNYATSDVMQITLQIRFDAADIHGQEVFDATSSGALTSGVMSIGAGNQAT
jgi:hypothetical protein